MPREDAAGGEVSAYQTKNLKHTNTIQTNIPVAQRWPRIRHESFKKTLNECFRFNSTQSDPRPLSFHLLKGLLRASISSAWLYQTCEFHVQHEDRILKQIIIQRTSQEPSSSKGLLMKESLGPNN